MLKKSTKKIQFIFFTLLLLYSFFSPFNDTIAEDINRSEIQEFTQLSNQKLAEIPYEDTPQLDYINKSNMDVFTTADRFESYNLFIVNRLSGSYVIVLVITDMDGNVIKEKYIGTSASVTYVSAEFINATHILYGAPEGARLWNFYTDEDVYLGFYGHHEYEYNPLQGTYFSFKRHKVDIDETTYLFDYIREYNKTGGIVWELSTYTFQATSMWCPYHDTINGDQDISHSNTIFFDADEDMIYYNSRNTNTFYKIDHSTSTVVWALGEYGDFALYDLKGNLKNNLFYHAHSVEKIDDNKFLLFDNDYHNQTDSSSKISRLVEITIDENTMTANETWTWEAPVSYYSYYWGDSDSLPNGNIFGTFGTFEHGSSISIGARMIEVNPAGDIVWEINFPMTSYRYGIYRAERFGFSPFVNASSEIFAGSGTDVSATFQTWYNFRSKTKITGSYELYLDESLIDSGTVQFDEFWRVTNLTFDLGVLADGQHNLTIAVADEVDHTTIKTMAIHVGPFFIERTSPTEMELGEVDSIISWSGYAVTPLEFNLTINGTHEFSDTWSGEVTEFDLNSLTPGIHNFTVQLFNGTDLLFNETFWVTIFPNSLPIFNNFPSDQAIMWGSTLMLSWNVTDSSLYKIDLYLNGTITDQIEFLVSPSEYIYNYDFQILDEALYNVTVEVTDRTLGSISKTTWIEVTPPSPPIISQNPINEMVHWGQVNISFLWEVHGASDSSWIVLKNGSTFASGILSDKFIEISVDDWYNIEWYPGTYNLTLFVEDTYGNTTSSTTFIKIVIAGDPYADEFIQIASLYYINGENAVGAPDGDIAQVFADYGSGYIILDMGRDEDIIDGEGDDVQIISYSGQYSCWVSNSLENQFTILGISEGNASFDLNDAIDSARYVRIEYVSGGIATIDAVVALNYLIQETDNVNPEITGHEDFQIYSNVTSFTISWQLYDLTPFNFSITINGEEFDSGFWNGSYISLTYFWDEIGFYEIELILYDLFGNTATDVVNVQVVDIEDIGKTGRPYLYFLFLLSLAAIPVFLFIRKRRV